MDFPAVDDLTRVPTGDMPGDSVQVSEAHLAKARTVFPVLWDLLEPVLAAGPHHRAVVAVHGGSGVGKSEIGSLLAYGLNQLGVGAYVLSGDNYPHRVPSANDAERLRTFRAAGARALVDAGLYDAAVRAELAELRAADQDAAPAQVTEHPWLATYIDAGRGRRWRAYLGNSNEIAFDELSAILTAFHDGARSLMLKRMGRTVDEVWYDEVDVSDVQVIVLEWTHGNNEHLRGVDLPILLNSTPEETLAHRRRRNRDGGVDSPFTTMVLGIEQEMLRAQAHRAAIIVAKSGEIQHYATYLAAMGEGGPDAGPMLNVVPRLGRRDTLAGSVAFLRSPEAAGAFTSAYLLPSVFNTDLDRGFSVIDYQLSDLYATRARPRRARRGGDPASSSTSSSTTPRCCPRSSRTCWPGARSRRSRTSSSTGTRSGRATAR